MIIDKFSSNLQLEIQSIVNILSSHTKRAYLVGGCVRDLFLNNKIKDLDIEVYDISPNSFNELMEQNSALGVGKSFFVYKLKNVDLALPRVEKKTGLGHKAFEVEITDNEKIASKRRDFSMNAMMINIFTGELLDFWSGQESIKQQKISLINEKTFKEDSLRVLRAVQFSARFGFEIDKKTLDIMHDIELEDLSKTRILWELEKIFIAKHLEIGFIYMCKLKLFEKFFTCSIRCEGIEEELKKIYSKNLYYFFYIIANMSGFDPLDWFKKLEAPNHYLKTFKNQPFYKNGVSDKELFIIAINMPIKKWLGNYKKDVIKRAKKFDIYHEVFSGGVTIAKVIKDGFKKENIKDEYKRRVMKKIENKFNV
ncbi:MAG: CCA tRNA nucleotidyltransferase [Sulfurospirillum sp.]|nr:CCA tRNA nucleotidyltransferase [Sulfurospirillum sp.]